MLKEKQVYSMGTTGHSIDTFNATGMLWVVKLNGKCIFMNWIAYVI